MDSTWRILLQTLIEQSLTNIDFQHIQF